MSSWKISFDISLYLAPCPYFLILAYVSCNLSLLKFYFYEFLYPFPCPYFFIFSCVSCTISRFKF